jgi:hypothetical protein
VCAGFQLLHIIMHSCGAIRIVKPDEPSLDSIAPDQIPVGNSAARSIDFNPPPSATTALEKHDCRLGVESRSLSFQARSVRPELQLPTTPRTVVRLYDCS